MAASKRINTPTEQNKEDNQLVLYRLELVEAAVKDVGGKLDKLDNIKRSDLIEFRDTISKHFEKVEENLQKQIDGKADKSDVEDIKKIMYAAFAFFFASFGSVVVYYVTTGAK